MILSMKKIIFTLAIALMGLGLHAQGHEGFYRGQDAAKAGGKQLEEFKSRLRLMSKSDNEATLTEARYGYYGIGDGKTADSLGAVIRKRFPRGTTMRDADCQNVLKAVGGIATEKAYLAWAKRYPESRLGRSGIYDRAAVDVASKYADDGNDAKAFAYVRKCADPQWVAAARQGVAARLSKAGKPDAAGLMLKEGCQYADTVLTHLEGKERAQVASLYATYAEWLAKNGKEAEAWDLYNNKVDDKWRNISYMRLALAHGQTMEVWTALDRMLRQGNMPADGKALMTSVWQKVDGNADGFNRYVEQAAEEHLADRLAALPRQMVNRPAPDFTLCDAYDNDVQLSKLRGKVVVLDFWATWCGPCKRSLPAMQKALRKYKDDHDVAFFFIHTWETDTPEAATRDAVAYLHANGFDDFRLLMDTRDPDTRVNKAVTAFGVKGIPAKFVIDKKGNIRFEVSGFSGTDDDAVIELSRMIELARQAS